MDGTRTFKLLKVAAHRLSIWDPEQRESDGHSSAHGRGSPRITPN
jgi:hypothetical protein